MKIEGFSGGWAILSDNFTKYSVLTDMKLDRNFKYIYINNTDMVEFNTVNEQMYKVW